VRDIVPMRSEKFEHKRNHLYKTKFVETHGEDERRAG
jgi:hypothetical protein